MKPVAEARDAAVGMSRPVRGAWIETPRQASLEYGAARSRPVRGAWIETSADGSGTHPGPGRAPCGARGLKRPQAGHAVRESLSRPVWGAWIETP